MGLFAEMIIPTDCYYSADCYSSPMDGYVLDRGCGRNSIKETLSFTKLKPTSFAEVKPSAVSFTEGEEKQNLADENKKQISEMLIKCLAEIKLVAKDQRNPYIASLNMKEKKELIHYTKMNGENEEIITKDSKGSSETTPKFLADKGCCDLILLKDDLPADDRITDDHKAKIFEWCNRGKVWDKALKKIEKTERNSASENKDNDEKQTQLDQACLDVKDILDFKKSDPDSEKTDNWIQKRSKIQRKCQVGGIKDPFETTANEVKLLFQKYAPNAPLSYVDSTILTNKQGNLGQLMPFIDVNKLKVKDLLHVLREKQLDLKEQEADVVKRTQAIKSQGSAALKSELEKAKERAEILDVQNLQLHYGILKTLEDAVRNTQPRDLTAESVRNYARIVNEIRKIKTGITKGDETRNVEKLFSSLEGHVTDLRVNGNHVGTRDDDGHFILNTPILNKDISNFDVSKHFGGFTDPKRSDLVELINFLVQSSGSDVFTLVDDDARFTALKTIWGFLMKHDLGPKMDELPVGDRKEQIFTTGENGTEDSFVVMNPHESRDKNRAKNKLEEFRAYVKKLEDASFFKDVEGHPSGEKVPARNHTGDSDKFLSLHRTLPPGWIPNAQAIDEILGSQVEKSTSSTPDVDSSVGQTNIEREKSIYTFIPGLDEILEEKNFWDSIESSEEWLNGATKKAQSTDTDVNNVTWKQLQSNLETEQKEKIEGLCRDVQGKYEEFLPGKATLEAICKDLDDITEFNVSQGPVKLSRADFTKWRNSISENNFSRNLGNKHMTGHGVATESPKRDYLSRPAVKESAVKESAVKDPGRSGNENWFYFDYTASSNTGSSDQNKKPAAYPEKMQQALLNAITEDREVWDGNNGNSKWKLPREAPIITNNVTNSSNTNDKNSLPQISFPKLAEAIECSQKFGQMDARVPVESHKTFKNKCCQWKWETRKANGEINTFVLRLKDAKGTNQCAHQNAHKCVDHITKERAPATTVPTNNLSNDSILRFRRACCTGEKLGILKEDDEESVIQKCREEEKKVFTGFEEIAQEKKKTEQDECLKTLKKLRFAIMNQGTSKDMIDADRYTVRFRENCCNKQFDYGDIRIDDEQELIDAQQPVSILELGRSKVEPKLGDFFGIKSGFATTGTTLLDSFSSPPKSSAFTVESSIEKIEGDTSSTRGTTFTPTGRTGEDQNAKGETWDSFAKRICHTTPDEAGGDEAGDAVPDKGEARCKHFFRKYNAVSLSGLDRKWVRRLLVEAGCCNYDQSKYSESNKSTKKAHDMLCAGHVPTSSRIAGETESRDIYALNRKLETQYTYYMNLWDQASGETDDKTLITGEKVEKGIYAQLQQEDDEYWDKFCRSDLSKDDDFHAQKCAERPNHIEAGESVTSEIKSRQPDNKQDENHVVNRNAEAVLKPATNDATGTKEVPVSQAPHGGPEEDEVEEVPEKDPPEWDSSDVGTEDKPPPLPVSEAPKFPSPKTLSLATSVSPVSLPSNKSASTSGSSSSPTSKSSFSTPTSSFNPSFNPSSGLTFSPADLGIDVKRLSKLPRILSLNPLSHLRLNDSGNYDVHINEARGNYDEVEYPTGEMDFL